ncbi:MAG: hypothetical protein JRF63_12395, partial [Deltaproteobacteria bacterium]|nr:hypothetical protein [Deltaproteobacteria bacterium]
MQATLTTVLAALISLVLVYQAEAATLRGVDENGKLQGPFVAVEGHVSLFSDIAERSMAAGTFGYGARGGYRWNDWGLFL